MHKYKYQFNGLGFTTVALFCHASEMRKKNASAVAVALLVPIVLLEDLEDAI